MKQFIKQSSGFTIIEVIVALFILTVSLFGFFQVSNYIIAKINTSDYRISAINYAAGGVEIVRGIRDFYLTENLNYGWDDDIGRTDEIDSFIELVHASDTGDFIIEPLYKSDDDTEDAIHNGFTLKPIEDDETRANWELVSQDGFLRYLRKVKIEDVEGQDGKLKKVTLSVYFDDETYYDTIHVSTFLGNIASKM